MSGTALVKGRYLIWRKFLTKAPIRWPCCQQRFGFCRKSSVYIPALSPDCISCGARICDAGRCGAGNCGKFWLKSVAICWRSRLMIWSASTCSYDLLRTLYSGMSTICSACYFSRAWIASIRLSSKVIISLAKRVSAADKWILNCRIRDRSCASRWSIKLISISIEIF